MHERAKSRGTGTFAGPRGAHHRHSHRSRTAVARASKGARVWRGLPPKASAPSRVEHRRAHRTLGIRAQDPLGARPRAAQTDPDGESRHRGGPLPARVLPGALSSARARSQPGGERAGSGVRRERPADSRIHVTCSQVAACRFTSSPPRGQHRPHRPEPGPVGHQAAQAPGGAAVSPAAA